MELQARTEGPVMKRKGRKYMVPMFLAATEEQKTAGANKAGNVVMFSNAEVAVLKAFTRTCSYQKTSEETGITIMSVKRYLRRPEMRRYLQEVVSRATISQDTDLSWLIKELRLTVEGARKPDEGQLSAMKQLGKVLAPRGPEVQVNLQTNIYGNMNREVLESEWTDARTTATA